MKRKPVDCGKCFYPVDESGFCDVCKTYRCPNDGIEIVQSEFYKQWHYCPLCHAEYTLRLVQRPGFGPDPSRVVVPGPIER